MSNDNQSCPHLNTGPKINYPWLQGNHATALLFAWAYVGAEGGRSPIKVYTGESLDSENHEQLIKDCETELNHRRRSLQHGETGFPAMYISDHALVETVGNETILRIGDTRILTYLHGPTE